MDRKPEIMFSRPYPGGTTALSFGTVIQVDTSVQGSVTDVDIEWKHLDLVLIKKYTTTYKRLRGTIEGSDQDEAVVYFPKDKWDNHDYMAKRDYEKNLMKFEFKMTEEWYSVRVVSTVKSNSDDLLGHAATLIAAVEPSAPSNMYNGRFIYEKIEDFEIRANLDKKLKSLMEVPLKDCHFKKP